LDVCGFEIVLGLSLKSIKAATINTASAMMMFDGGNLREDVLDFGGRVFVLAIIVQAMGSAVVVYIYTARGLNFAVILGVF
jgi:hypothetical protein